MVFTRFYGLNNGIDRRLVWEQLFGVGGSVVVCGR